MVGVACEHDARGVGVSWHVPGRVRIPAMSKAGRVSSGPGQGLGCKPTGQSSRSQFRVHVIHAPSWC